MTTLVRLPASIDEDRAIDRAAWTSMAASIRLPTGELDEDRLIDLVATVLIPMVRHKLTPEFSREWLEKTLQQGLREGRLPLTAHAIKAAEAGDEIADAALRSICAEMMSAGRLPEQGPGWMQIWTYGQRALVHGPHKRPQGRRWHDDFVRNIEVCNIIYFVCRQFDMSPSRNEATRDADGPPSGISVVVAALARHGIHLKEANVQRNVWQGLPGELVRTIAPTLFPAADRQLNPLRRRLLNGVSHVSLIARPEIVHIPSDWQS